MWIERRVGMWIERWIERRIETLAEDPVEMASPAARGQDQVSWPRATL